jgi:endonuclease III
MRVENFIQTLEAQHPAVRCELVYFTPFQCILSVLFSAQTTDKMVNRTWGQYLIQNPGITPEHILHMGEKALLSIIQGVGLAPSKAKNAYQTAQLCSVIDRQGFHIPNSIETLCQLPGVGRKTALVVLNEVFGLPTLPVDTHVFRVTHKLGIAKKKDTTPEAVEQRLTKYIAKQPTHIQKKVHLQLVHHGRYICQAKKPLCASCLFSSECPSVKI